jgi:hypothetical protein
VVAPSEAISPADALAALPTLSMHVEG